jgi:hypothetical protein
MNPKLLLILAKRTGEGIGNQRGIGACLTSSRFRHWKRTASPRSSGIARGQKENTTNAVGSLCREGKDSVSDRPISVSDRSHPRNLFSKLMIINHLAGPPSPFEPKSEIWPSANRIVLTAARCNESRARYPFTVSTSPGFKESLLQPWRMSTFGLAN